MEELAKLFSRIISERRIPDILKLAYKLSIPKKGKDARIQSNHRGIAIGPILCKVLEHVCLEEGVKSSIPQDGLQFGFSEGKSPSMASLVITGAIAESKTMKEPLYIASLDAKQAFDRVDHNLLKIKMFKTGVHKRLWNVIDDLYMGGQEVVRINGIYSRPYKVSQGVKQGGVSSPAWNNQDGL